MVCVDVDYRAAGAVAAALWFHNWADAAPVHQATATFGSVAEYEPGAFYKRELPCLLGVLTAGPSSEIVVVDGYVWLASGAPGLGAHLHTAIGGVVVGVAKTRYASATGVVEVCRGDSRSPLFISAVGVPVADAAEWVRQMHGPYRVPTLLRAVDSLARTASA